MKKYKVELTRTYIITIKALNLELAKQYAEYYMDSSRDISSENDREDKRFKIYDSEMMINEAMENINTNG